MPAHHLTWHQYNVVFASHEKAEQIAARHLLPALSATQADESLDLWWYIRKQPAWRFRYLAQPGSDIGPVLDQFIDQKNITSWTAGIYEPETTAFGGDDAMRAAHELFHHDSRHILARATQPTGDVLGRRENMVLMCTAMLRAAGLDWYEQADVWHKVAALRAGAGSLPAWRAAQLVPAIHRLLNAGTHIPGTGPGNEWVRAFEQAGQTLAALAAAGTLRRGLRAVLAHHVIFHANRAGISVRDQAILAALAADTMFGACPGQVSFREPTPAHS
jgi:protein-L-isoaspartate(D-aspartate) O-methyltransferase